MDESNDALSRVLEDLECNVTLVVPMLANVTPNTRKSAIQRLSQVQTDITKAVKQDSAAGVVSLHTSVVPDYALTTITLGTISRSGATRKLRGVSVTPKRVLGTF
jgi:hypothetical protein